MTAEATQTDEPKPPGFWQKRLVLPIKNQLTQGASPEALSRAVVVALACGVFPILGTTTFVGLLAGIVLRLNQTVIQSINFLSYPLHIALILPFVRIGEKLFRVDPVPFSIPKMLALIKDSPSAFFGQYGMTCVHCICAWLVIAPLVAFLLYPLILPLIRKLRPSAES